MRIAPAGPEDATRLAALHAQAFERAWSEKDLLELMGGVGAMTFASEEGFILVRSLGPEAEVITLAVAPAARRRGLGRALVETAAAAVAAGGAEALFLEVAADNAPALALYESTGFVRAGHRPGYYARPPGPAVDALTLRRMLSPPAP